MANATRTASGSNGKDRYTVRPNYRTLAECGWSDIDADMVLDLITTVTKAGGAVMFGVTSDGGALSLCVLDQSSKLKEYPRTQDEVHSFIMWLKDEYFVQPLPAKTQASK